MGVLAQVSTGRFRRLAGRAGAPEDGTASGPSSDVQEPPTVVHERVGLAGLARRHKSDGDDVVAAGEQLPDVAGKPSGRVVAAMNKHNGST